MQTQTSDGIFDRFAASVNPSVGTGTGFKIGESSQEAYDNMKLNQLKDIVVELG
jgi:hypothetical protein